MAKKGTNKVWIWVGLATLVAAGVGIYFYVNSKRYKSGNKQKDDRQFSFKRG